MGNVTRSEARRAYLTKAAQMLPFNSAQGLVFPGMFGGGSTAGDASIAALGLTLGAPAAQLANLGGVLTGIARKRRTRKEQQEPDEQKKAAEAPDAEYIEGFCKAAEAMGVDPVALYKQAAPWAAISKMVGKGMGMVRANGVRGALREGTLRARSGIRNYYDLLRGANVDKYKRMEESMANLTRRAGRGAPTRENMQLYARGTQAWGNATAARRAAEQATHNARSNLLGVAAGAGVLGVGGAMWSARMNRRASGGTDQPQRWTHAVRKALYGQ